MSERFDPASHSGSASNGTPTSAVAAAIELTTDAVPAVDRLEFWRDTALRRMVPVRFFDTERPFHGRLRRISGDRAELIDHATDAMWAERSQQRCSADSSNDIAIDFMLACTNTAMKHQGETIVRAGDMRLIDYSQPLQVRRSRHRSLALMLRRDKVAEVLGDDLSMLAGRKLPELGIANLLRTHLRRTSEEAMQFSPIEQKSAIDAASAMALAALQTLVHGCPDTDQVAEGLYIVSREAIKQHCVNAELSPLALATIVGCSRATLYRLFSRRDQSVSAAIWDARLELAQRMLADPAQAWLPIGEIAFRCGFLDQSNFSRMFKRRYGITPRDERGTNALPSVKPAHHA